MLHSFSFSKKTQEFQLVNFFGSTDGMKPFDIGTEFAVFRFCSNDISHLNALMKFITLLKEYNFITNEHKLQSYVNYMIRYQNRIDSVSC